MAKGDYHEQEEATFAKRIIEELPKDLVNSSVPRIEQILARS
jgi:protein required for attachment to host cells